MKKVLSILILVIINVSCDDTAGGSRHLMDVLPAISPAQQSGSGELPGTVVPLDQNIKFALYDAYDSVKDGKEYAPRILLYMQTENEYACCNYGIDSRITIDRDIITCEILGIIQPAVCLTAFGPAVYRVPLAVAEGDFVFRLVNGEKTDEYSVRISRDSILVNPVQKVFSYPAFNTYWRFPERTFALSCQAPGEFAFVCEDLKNLLTTVFPLEEFTFPAEGAVCYALYTGSSHFGDQIPGLQYYRYASEADFIMMESVFRTFCVDVLSGIEGVGITLRNWVNQSYLSWMF